MESILLSLQMVDVAIVASGKMSIHKTLSTITTSVIARFVMKTVVIITLILNGPISRLELVALVVIQQTLWWFNPSFSCTDLMA